MTVETGTSVLPVIESNTQNKQGTACHICRRSFRGLLQQLNTCRQRNTTTLNASSNDESDENNDNKVQEP